MPPRRLNPTSGAAGRARDEAFDCLVASNGPEITPPHSPVQHPLSRAARRRADREITRLIKRDGDRCTICHAALTHNCKTYGGVTASGNAAITGECCASKLAFVHGAGFYLDRSHRYDFLGSGSGKLARMKRPLPRLTAIARASRQLTDGRRTSSSGAACLKHLVSS